MRQLPRLLCFTLFAAASAGSPAAPATECSALQAEVEMLRAKLRTLETAAPAETSTPAVALPGTAPKPAAVATLVVEEPYSKTGCSKGLFKGIAEGRWQDAELWLDLAKGQSPAEVEKQLGVEHYDKQGGANIIWHYGRCGASSRAQVLFANGRLADWRAPSN